jgi:hypothetical protein
VGKTLQVGPRAAIAIVKRDSRCKIMTLEPDTTKPLPELMKRLARDHEGQAGIYGVVLAEGTICRNDKIALLE